MKAFLQASISIALLAAVIVWIGPGKVIGSFSMVSWWSILLALCIAFVVILLHAARMGVLVWNFNPHHSLNMLREASMAFALGTFSPSRVGEAYIIKRLHDHGIPMGAASGIFLVDRVLSLAVLALFALLSSIYLPYRLAFLLSILTLIAAAVLLAASPGILGLLKRILPKRITEKFIGLRKALVMMRNDWRALTYNFLIGIVHFSMRSLIIVVLFIGIGIHLPFLLIFAINAMVTMAAAIPISLGGIGVREASASLLFQPFGVENSLLVSAYLMASLIAYLSSAVVIACIRKR